MQSKGEQGMRIVPYRRQCNGHQKLNILLVISSITSILLLALTLICKHHDTQCQPETWIYESTVNIIAFILCPFLQLHLHRVKHFFPLFSSSRGTHLVHPVLTGFNIRYFCIHLESSRLPFFIGSKNKTCFHLSCFQTWLKRTEMTK